jgi:hypothetical protein
MFFDFWMFFIRMFVIFLSLFPAAQGFDRFHTGCQQGRVERG